MRNQIIALASATAVAVGLTLPAAAGDITVVSWGGAYTKSQIEAYHKPWIAESGNGVNSVDYSGGLAEIKSQVETGNVTWDVVDVELSDAIRGCDEGLFEEIDLSMLPPGSDGTPAADDFIDGALHDCAVANIVWSTVYAYDTSKFADDKQPQSMADFFDVENFPGKRGMRKDAKPNLEMALLGDGVDPSEVYAMLATPEGVDRAFAKLDSIKEHLLWWEAGSQPPQLLADGEVVMTTAYNGRIFNAIVEEGQPFEIVWDGQILDLDLFVIPKGSKNLDLALDFVAFSTGTKPLADQASYISYGPARASSVPFIGHHHAATGVDMAPHMPTAPANLKRYVLSDAEFWADYDDELNERFNAWLSS